MSVSREVYEGVGPNGIDVREYSNGDTGLPSVTTVLKTRDEDKSNLYAWQDRNDGEGDNANHSHLFWYARNRGTLSHFHALKTIDDSLQWSEDEAESLWELGNVHQMNDEEENPDVHDATPMEVLYSVYNNQYSVATWGEFYDAFGPFEDHEVYSEALLERKDRDVEFFVETFEHIVDELGITDEHVLFVEEFLFNEEDGYAGQVDFVYECPTTGENVVADLKTSSGCYDKHKIQGSAYTNSVEKIHGIDVGRTEVWRIHPDSGQWAVHAAEEITPLHNTSWWTSTHEERLETFLDLADNFEYET